MRNATSGVLYRDLNEPPPMIVGGSGVHLEGADGRRYLDGNASAGVAAVGHGRTEIFEALAAAGARASFVYGGSFTHPWQEELAAAILSVAPPSMAAAYFVSGGSEANESALKLARQYFVERGKPQKFKAIARRQSYHGVTMATLALSGRTAWRTLYAPYLMPVGRAAAPYRYRCEFCREAAACSLACADDVERAILFEGPETVAAVFAETVVGTTASALIPDDRYYRRVREICDAHDVLLVADEVLCGYGRTGRPFAIQHWGVEPDIITMGKGIGAGYAALGAMLVGRRVVEALADGSGRFVHGLTYSGMPASCLVGLQVFAIMRREGLFERAASVGPELKAGIEGLAARHPSIGEVRGLGLLLGVEFVADRATRTPFPAAAGFTRRLVAAMRARGVLVGAGVAGCNLGRDGDHIQISPPLTIEPAHCNVIVAALDDALAEVERQAP